jgi:hypothetical protein
VQHSSFVALSGQEVPVNDIDRGIGVSTCTTYYNEEMAHGHNSRPCEPHRCSSCRKTCYGPIEPNGKHRFMEEVSIITLFMLFIVIYLFRIMCIYIDISFYVVLQFLHLRSRPSTSMDAPVPSPNIDATIEAAFSLGAPHTHVCVTYYKFTLVISLFYGILKFLMLSCFYMIWE